MPTTEPSRGPPYPLLEHEHENLYEAHHIHYAKHEQETNRKSNTSGPWHPCQPIDHPATEQHANPTGCTGRELPRSAISERKLLRFEAPAAELGEVPMPI